MTVSTRATRVILEGEYKPNIELSPGRYLQVLKSIEDLPHCLRNQSAAFLADEKMLVVWGDNPMKMLLRAQHLEEDLMKMCCGMDTDEIQGQDDNGSLVDTSDVSSAWLHSFTSVTGCPKPLVSLYVVCHLTDALLRSKLATVTTSRWKRSRPGRPC